MTSPGNSLFTRIIPDNLQKDLIFHCHIYLSKNIHHDIIITQGPMLYEIRNRQILSLCDLSNSVLTGKFYKPIRCNISCSKKHLLKGTYPTIAANNTQKNANIKFEVKFSYCKNVKEVFYFVKINSDFAIIGKRGNELFVSERHTDSVFSSRINGNYNICYRC